MIAQVELKCVCGRVLKQTRSVMVERAKQGKPLRCMGCGKNLALPPDLLAEAAPDKAVKRVRTACPLCGAIVMAGNERGPFSGRCPDGCGVVFTCDEGGQIADDAVRPSARVVEVDQNAARLAKRPELLLAVKWRCSQSALAPGELGRALDALDRIAGWKAPPKKPFLPLPRELAVSLIGPVIFRAPSSEVRADGEIACLFEEAGKTLVTGLKVKAGDAAETHFFGANETGGNTSFVVKVYVDRTQQYFDATDADRLVDIMFRGKGRIEAFICAQLMFGPLVQTGNWARLTRDSVVARLKQAGVQQTDAVRVARDFLVA